MSDAPRQPDRLTRMINRLVTQRRFIDYAARALQAVPGAVVELGLGKGRTYDRLRQVFGERDVYAVDAVVHCPADVCPPDSLLLVGDFRACLRDLAARLPGQVALVHADIGSDDRAADARLAAELSPLIEPLLAPGALVLSDRELRLATCSPLPTASLRQDWAYFAYRHEHPDSGTGVR